MFDIGFSELVLLGIIALVVLGPDRLPGALRTAGLWIGRLRRSFNSIKADIEREVGADEIRRQLRNEAIMEKIKATRSQVTQSIESVKSEAEAVTQDLSLKDLAGEARKHAEPPPADDQEPATAEATSAAQGGAGAAGVTGPTPAAEESAPSSPAPPPSSQPAPQPMPSAPVRPEPEPVPASSAPPAPESAQAKRKESGQK